MPDPVELYLIRHGVAEERGAAWPDDSKRPLTDNGMTRVRKSARGLDELGVTFDVILTSPLVRTRQTAEIIAGELDSHPHVVQVHSLAPGGTNQTVMADCRTPAVQVQVEAEAVGNRALRGVRGGGHELVRRRADDLAPAHEAHEAQQVGG